MESATSQVGADVLGAYPDFRTPFKLIFMAESYFFIHDLKIKEKFKKEEEKRGKNVAAQK